MLIFNHEKLLDFSCSVLLIQNTKEAMDLPVFSNESTIFYYVKWKVFGILISIKKWGSWGWIYILIFSAYIVMKRGRKKKLEGG